MNLNNLLRAFADLNCNKVYIKTLAANDNSKNQIYFARGSTEVLNIFPVREFIPHFDGKRKRETFIANVDFFWVDDEGNTSPAPHAKFIVYPEYPEVRFSGFLLGSRNAPSELMNTRESGRHLVIAVSEDRKIYGYVASSESELTNEIRAFNFEETEGIFNIISLEGKTIIKDSKQRLLTQLKRIHNLGWIKSKKLTKEGISIDCGDAPQCGGYTLEAELGITPNSNAAPDYLGWELKQFTVKNFNKLNSKAITLITPEPDGGYYANFGLKEFVYKYGYPDSKIPNRINFGGVFKNNIIASKTGLKLIINGFDSENQKIVKTDGGIFLLDENDDVASSWSFASILDHWNRKHRNASYIPSKVSKEGGQFYHYGNNILLGQNTDFTMFLAQLSLGNIYYDPALKVENIDTKPKGKPRSQFRIKSKYLNLIYHDFELFDLNTL